MDNVKNKEICLRPSITDLTSDEEVGVLMKRCWTEDPADRPDFTTLKAVIRKLNKYATKQKCLFFQLAFVFQLIELKQYIYILQRNIYTRNVRDWPKLLAFNTLV